MKIKINLDIKKEDIVIESKGKLGGDLFVNSHFHLKDLFDDRKLIDRLDEYEKCDKCELNYLVKTKLKTEFGEQEIKIQVPYKAVRPIIEEYSKTKENK